MPPIKSVWNEVVMDTICMEMKHTLNWRRTIEWITFGGFFAVSLFQVEGYTQPPKYRWIPTNLQHVKHTAYSTLSIKRMPMSLVANCSKRQWTNLWKLKRIRGWCLCLCLCLYSVQVCIMLHMPNYTTSYINGNDRMAYGHLEIWHIAGKTNSGKQK